MTDEEDRNLYAPDGYRYGVMFNDGGVREGWTGETQRRRAADAALALALRFAPDNITLARHLPGEPWERAIPAAKGSDQ